MYSPIHNDMFRIEITSNICFFLLFFSAKANVCYLKPYFKVLVMSLWIMLALANIWYKKTKKKISYEYMQILGVSLMCHLLVLVSKGNSGIMGTSKSLARKEPLTGEPVTVILTIHPTLSERSESAPRVFRQLSFPWLSHVRSPNRQWRNELVWGPLGQPLRKR